MQPGQLGLGIQQVDVRRSAVHEERNHRLGLRREMGRLGAQIERRRLVWLGRRGKRLILFLQEPRQSHAADAERLAGQKLAPRLGDLLVHEYLRMSSACFVDDSRVLR